MIFSRPNNLRVAFVVVIPDGCATCLIHSVADITQSTFGTEITNVPIYNCANIWVDTDVF